MPIKAKTKSQRNRKSMPCRGEQHAGRKSSVERVLRLAAMLNKLVLPWGKLLMPLLIILLWAHLPEPVRRPLPELLKLCPRS